MGLLRGAVGFFTFFAAFVLKTQHEPAWVFGLVLMMSAVGNGHRQRDRAVLRAAYARGVDPRGRARRAAHPARVRGALVRAARARRRGGGDRGRVGDRAGSRSTASCNATVADAGARPRVRALRDALPARVGARRRARGRLPGDGRRGIFLVALVLLFAGLSYVGAVRSGARRAATRRPTPAAAKSADRRREPPE